MTRLVVETRMNSRARIDIHNSNFVELYQGITPTTVTLLPVASMNIQGAKSIVTNALTPVFLGVVAGGGAVVTPVFCNGVAWIVG